MPHSWHLHHWADRWCSLRRMRWILMHSSFCSEEKITMKLVESMLKNNPCYKTGRKITVKGLMLHSVGCPQPKASVFINLWNKADYRNACVHAFIDGNDGTVYQTLPWNHRGWHCGSGKKGSGNNTHIGVEMCEPSGIKYKGGSVFWSSDMTTSAIAVVKRIYQSAVELFAMLCKEYNLNPLEDGVIISHREGHKRGIASNHGDPEHLWKGLGLPYTMDGFRKDVKAKMEKSETSNVPENPKKEFQVKISISDLNIRKGPGTNYDKTGKKTGKGTFTIVEEQSGKGSVLGWGKLKSGAGWISLDFVTRI